MYVSAYWQVFFSVSDSPPLPLLWLSIHRPPLRCSVVHQYTLFLRDITTPYTYYRLYLFKLNPSLFVVQSRFSSCFKCFGIINCCQHPPPPLTKKHVFTYDYTRDHSDLTPFSFVYAFLGLMFFLFFFLYLPPLGPYLPSLGPMSQLRTNYEFI